MQFSVSQRPEDVAPGQVKHISSGQVSTNETVSSGGELYVLSGGVANGTAVLFGGQLIDSGLTSGVGLSGGYEFVDSFGVASNTVLHGGGEEEVGIYGTASGVVVGSGATFLQDYGGVGIGVIQRKGGIISAGQDYYSGTLSAFGTVSNLQLENGAALFVESGGQASGIYADDEMTTMEVLSGGYSYSAGILTELTVDAGGLASLTSANGGDIFVHGSTISSDVYGNVEEVFSGGSTTSSTIDFEATEQVDAGGSAFAANVLSSGFLSVGSGGATSSATISAGGTADIAFGGVGGVTVLHGLETVEGRTIDTQVESGGDETIESGGIASGADITDSGVMHVHSGGAARAGVQVYSGGTLVLGEGATATDVYVGDGGVVSGGGGVLSGASNDVFGVVGDVTVGLHASLTADFDGEVVSTTVLSGGLEALNVSGTNSAVVVSSGATFQLVSETINVELDLGVIAAETTLSGTTLLSGAKLATLYALIASDGLETIAAGGTATSTEIQAGGELIVSSGGRASATLEDVGGVSVVSGGVIAGGDVFGQVTGPGVLSGGWIDGGVISGLTLVSGATVSVLSGGEIDHAHVRSGGAILVSAGARARQAYVSAGGALVDNGGAVWAGGGTTTFDGTLKGKGKLFEGGPGTLVLDGVQTAFAGEAILSGGTIELASVSALGSGSVDFAATADRKTLKIEAAAAPANGARFAATLLDFDSSSATYLNLASVAFVSGATATLGGHTLTLHDGAYTAAFTLGGTAASAYSVFSDGAHGTLIRAATGAGTMPLVQMMAAFASAAPASAASDPRAGQPDSLPVPASSHGELPRSPRTV